MRLTKWALLLLKELYMALGSRTNSFDRAAARTGSPHGWRCVMTLSLVVAWSLLLQGCLPGAWLALVAVDTIRHNYATDESFEQSWVGQMGIYRKSSSVTFGPFERSWVASQDRLDNAADTVMVRSVAVLPAEGDPEMGVRLASLLQEETTLRVESPAPIAEGVIGTDPLSGKADDDDRSALAKEITQNLDVDTVLVSRVTDSSSHPSDWGRKPEGARRLYLYLLNREGQLLWKDELPFTLGKGATSLQGASMQADFSHHVMQQVKTLRLDEMGYLPNKEKGRKSNRPSATLTPLE